MSRIATLILAAALLPGVRAAAQTVAITPRNSEIGYTVYAFGLLPVVGRFQQFGGTLTWLPNRSHACQVDINVMVASLHMDDADRQREALAPDMLDAASHPNLRFVGACTGAVVAGRLTMHGATRPFAVTWHEMPNQVVGVGALRRTDFGINGMRGLVSQTVHIRFTVAIPAVSKK